MSTAKEPWFPQRDEKSAAYVRAQLNRLATIHMLIGQSLDASRKLLEESIKIEQDLRLALRDGVYQLPLNL